MAALRCKFRLGKDAKTSEPKIILWPQGDPVELAARLETIENIVRGDPDNVWIDIRGSV